jgi:uncharacterized paraquat-inducible protein A
MIPSIQLRCAGCNARIKAPVQIIGQERDCPRCGRRLTVRMKAPEDSGPVILYDDSSSRAPRRWSGSF